MKYFLFILVLAVGLFSCDFKSPKEDSESVSVLLVEEVLEKHPDGSVKAIEEFEMVDGVKKIYGYKEFYPSGKVKIEGRYNVNNQREGLWQAFYENGNKWSIGTYVDGEENGEKKVGFKNGKLRYTGQMKKNKPTGEWHIWNELGEESTKIF